MSRTLVAVDLGAQSGRVAVGRFDGRRLAVEEVHRFPNVPVRLGATLHWDVLRLYAEVLDGLRLAARENNFDSIAVDSWGVDFGLLDRAGRLVQAPVHYRDARRAQAVAPLLERVSARELYERTGIQLMPINTIFELAAMAAEPDPVLEIAELLQLVPDLFHHWLCGSRTTELTNATTTQCRDVRTGGWATDLLELAGAPADLLPDTVAPGTPLGPMLQDTAAEVGVRSAAVVAGATHDTAAAVVAVPLRGDGSAFLSVGTWSLVGIESAEPVVTDASFEANLTNEGGVAGTWRVLRNVTGLWLLHECRRVWSRAGREYDDPELGALAASAPALRSLVDPNDPVFAEPGDMPAKIAEYCAQTGQESPADDGAVVRCILESLALKHAETVDLIGRVTGRQLDELHIVGGGANNELLCAWTAEAADRRVVAGPAEATVIGNLLVQAIALGEISSLAEAREVVRSSFSPLSYEPGGGDAWPEARGRLTALSAARSEVEVGA
jgi:rhamnulokinase